MKVRRIDFYPADWLEGTRELDCAAVGCYITICALIYARGGPITIDLLKAHSIDHGNVINAAVNRLEKARKIVRNGPEIDQKRCENELERSYKRHTKAEENAAKRWNNNKVQDADASHSSNASRRYLQQSSINNQQTREHRSAPPNGSLSSRSPSEEPAPKPCQICGQPHANLDEFKAAHPINIPILRAPGQ